MVIEYLTKNGVMDPSLLYEPPYTDLSPTGVDGLFNDGQAEQIVQILSAINQNAGIVRQSA
jgi:type I restriction enzyme, R subunit